MPRPPARHSSAEPIARRTIPIPRLYSDLADFWPFVSPPENYVEEAATFRTRFERHGVRPGAHVLHLGSGGGSLDCQLKTTYRVTGVDVSAAMIMHAKRVNPEVEYVCGDIRTVRLGRTFDAVLVHDAIAYMTSVTELEQVYHTAAAHLEPGGVMVALPEELRTRFVQDRTEVKTRTRGARTVTFLEVDHDPDPADHSFEAVFVLVIREGNDVRIETDRHVLGLFELDEFLDAMRSAGFDPVAEPWELSDWEPGQEMPLITAVLRGGSTPTRPR